MNFFKKILEWLKHPRIWWFFCVLITFAAVLTGTVIFIVSGASGTEWNALGYVLYFLSAILLAYTIYSVIVLSSGIKRSVKERALKHDFTRKLIEQYGFRTIAFAVISLVISLANAVINGTIGIIYLSVWYGALAAYYFLLFAMRGGVLLYHRRKKKFAQTETEEQIKIRGIKTYGICGIWLILLPVALSAVIWETVASNRAFVRSGLLIYASAAYTFYKITMSCINFFKARRGDEITVRAIRNVNLADALVSVLALQTAMFHEFSPEESLGFANAILGAIVCALTAVIGTVMFVNAIIKIKKLKEKTLPDSE